ncbi:MAG: cell wall hydrolase [Lachnospiraceae bacterium]|nr:cell wall hydrolase [Lachnospiraceae bacterium]
MLAGTGVGAVEFETTTRALPLVAGAGAMLDPRATAADLPGGAPAKPAKKAPDETTPPEDEAAAPDSEEVTEAEEPEEKPVNENSTLVMADVNEVMNVRALPDASSEKVGVLYKDCGGTILERSNGWTKLQSGDLTGWANDDYLLFGDEAEALAKDVGVTLAKVTADALRVRKEADKNSGVYGLVKTGDEFEVISEDDGSGFFCIDYKGKDGYISSDYVTTRVKIDTGETWEAIVKREQEEKERKERLTRNQGAVAANTDEVKLLAALIMCEAGNQPYEGQLGVGAVVMNRVRSGAYPNTIYGVIYASGQFGPAANGSVAARYVGEAPIFQSCYTAANAAINGETSVGGALHFRRAGSHEGSVVIGSHVFW